ncbi:hypothetical protein BRC65_01035 [Halobacteriales archaeon QH_2_65_14]|jgi:hypothetical protein|nr:MAG: hypothetical protein BRC65_01035 [Halobacteriales archaeon QH_2_65_14]
MLGNIPVPKGPILDWIKSEYQGEGHETKQTVIQETADLANKILASYAFYIEGPDSPGPEHRAQFKNDIETYGKRAVELKKFALQSDAPEPPASDVELMLSAQESLAASDEESTTEELLNQSLESLGLSSDTITLDPKETLDDVFNRIDNDLYLMYYAILEQIVNKCVDYAISEEIDYQEFDELKVSLKVAMNRF